MQSRPQSIKKKNASMNEMYHKYFSLYSLYYLNLSLYLINLTMQLKSVLKSERNAFIRVDIDYF